MFDSNATNRSTILCKSPEPPLSYLHFARINGCKEVFFKKTCTDLWKQGIKAIFGTDQILEHLFSSTLSQLCLARFPVIALKSLQKQSFRLPEGHTKALWMLAGFCYILCQDDATLLEITFKCCSSAISFQACHYYICMLLVQFLNFFSVQFN